MKNLMGAMMITWLASAGLLGGCATDGDPADEASTEAALTTEAITIRSVESVLATAAMARAATAPGGPTTNAVPCRRVTASSIPVFSTATSGTVNCRFLAGDVFQYTAVSSNGRYLTWCPRHTPPEQGVFSWAQGAGTVASGC
jgi:hypothetical protein